MTRIYYFECDDCGYSWSYKRYDCPQCKSENVIDMSREIDDD
jgi:uncharacterized OB-fold protein